MTAIWMRARSELRSRLFALLSLGLIVGVLGGVVIAAAAGARRTETAYPRFVEAQHGLDAVVGTYGKGASEALRAAEALPSVSESTRLYVLALEMRTAEGRKAQPFFDFFPFGSPDGRFGTTINRIKILEGRAADPSRPDEVVVSFTVAEKFGLDAGDEVEFFPGNPFGGGVRIGENPIPGRVVGIGAAPGMFQPLAGGYVPGLFLTPAFFRAHEDLRDQQEENAAVVLRPGVTVREFRAELKELGDTLGKDINLVFSQPQQTAGVQQTTRAQAISLWVLAALVAVAGLAIFSQAMARQTFLESIEYPTLRSMGMSPRQLLTIGMIRAGTIGVVSGLVAVLVGFLLSPLTPTGTARIAEPNPGFAADGVVLAVGAAGTALIVALLGLFPAWRASRVQGGLLGLAEPRGRARPSVVVGFLARLGLAPSAVSGVRMALEPGRGPTAVPVRTTMFGAALGMLALATALSFGASLDHLVTTPRLSGWNWDSLVGVDVDGQLPSDARRAAERKLTRHLNASPSVSEYARGTLEEIGVGPLRHVSFIAMESVKGSVTPSLVDGHLPTTADEILLGVETAHDLGVGIGDTVPVSGPGGSYPMRVVGRTVMPRFFFIFSRPGRGAALSLAGAERLVPASVDPGFAFFVRFAQGVDQEKEVRTLGRDIRSFFVFPQETSQSVGNLNEVSDAPIALAGVMALMAAATLAHTLVTSIRRRRRDLAILKTVGFVTRQVSATVAWQATTLGVVSLAAGIPLGVMAGRWGWNFLAERLGVVPEPVVPLTVLLLVPATIVVANLLAVVPGWIASRLKAAPVLRSE